MRCVRVVISLFGLCHIKDEHKNYEIFYYIKHALNNDDDYAATDSASLELSSKRVVVILRKLRCVTHLVTEVKDLGL